MYLVGREHPLQAMSKAMLSAAVRRGETLVSDAEVLQEILHRYRATQRLHEMRWAFDVAVGLTTKIFPIEQADAQLARDILLTSKRLSARDAIHAAVMRRHGIKRLMSFDAGFDELPDIERITS